ncbi:DUF4249 domain-containing protein [Parabacteroides sp. OttesenSCG-928-G07]|nr:DUF4249 domain-containing protein [Parabacteroides sp. OttesenSCG-928-G21]MDL2278565.1 DUF4249 domain-containing protein [Parabacteroides sp. OttesenSCG-928-G07]
MKNLWIFILLSFSFSGCIEEFTPKKIEEVRGILVIDGTITNDESLITLRRTVSLQDTLVGSEIVENATMYVETNKGEKISGIYKEEGTYSILTGDLQADTQYRLHVSVEGEEFESSFLTPIFTTEIDSITFSKKAQGEPVTIQISTSDAHNQTPYYFWHFEENWEVKSQFFISSIMINDSTYKYYDLNTSNNIYYCWGKDYSNNILIGTSEKLSQNAIIKEPIANIACDHDKLSILYHITVYQQQIRKEAYSYFSNKKDGNERTGSIFSPVFSEMKGNIQCISDPEIPVIGYIEVSTTTQKELFIPENMGLYETPWSDMNRCASLFSEYGAERTPKECIDCRARKNATKNKPEWWPTDHL